MDWQWSIYLFPMVLAPIVAILLAYLLYINRSIGGSRRLSVLVLVAGWWSLLYGAAVMQTDLTIKWILYVGMYVGVTLTPIAWLLFVVDYVGSDDWVTRWRIRLLLVVPAISMLVAATNQPVGFHELFWTNPHLDSGGILLTMESGHGFWFWVHAAYSYAILASSAIYLVRLGLFSNRLHRIQAISLVVAAIIPISANVAYLTGVSPGQLDATGPALVVSGLVLATTIYRYRLLTVVPAARQLARSELVDRTPDPVLVVSESADVLDLNPAASDLFDTSRSEAVGVSLERIAPELAERLSDLGTETTQTDVAIEDGSGTRYFDVQIAPLSAGYGAVVGRLLSLRDVTDRRRREQRLSVLNRLLRHDLRNVMTTIRGNAEFVRSEIEDPEIDQRMGVIERNVDTIVTRRDKFDRVLGSLDIEKEPIEIVEVARHVIDESIRYAPDREVVLDAPEECWMDGHNIVMIALEELIENAIEHTDESVPVELSISASDDIVKIVVADEGPGVPAHEFEPVVSGRETPLEHSSGVGLWIAKWVVEALDGSIEFSIDDGTKVIVHLPRARGQPK